MFKNRNRLRDEVATELSTRFAWLARHDRKGLLVGAIEVINAVWFAAIWAAGFPIAPITGIWLVFFVVSMSVAVALERKR